MEVNGFFFTRVSNVAKGFDKPQKYKRRHHLIM